MREDDVKVKVVEDSLILDIGKLLVFKLKASKGEKHRYVANRLRNFRTLLLEYEKIAGHSVSLVNILAPNKFDVVI